MPQADATDLFRIAPVIPVVVLDDPQHAVPLARALRDGGIGIVEITLRTAAGLPAMERIAAALPDMIVGAGTLLAPEQIAAATDAGARFLVTPGTTPTLLDALAAAGLPYLPGVATVSEALTVLERGIATMKFFPAETSGGTTALRAFAGPLPHARFCPTGGVTAQNAPDYLALPNVDCVGGSWLTPASAVATRNWTHITTLATHAAALRPA